ncbi:MAG TPA: hypothetical protein PLS53_13950 [Thermoanaerobaculaceae bacterium]|nr:hypothetical protein [Thermoanaerobaculaceae bacterium]
MSAWLAVPGALVVLVVGAAYALWWLDRFDCEPLPRYVLTALLATTAGLALVQVPVPGWTRALQLGAATPLPPGVWVGLARRGVLEVLALLGVVGLWSRRSHLDSPLDGLVSGVAAGGGLALGGLVVAGAWAQDGPLEVWVGVVTALSAGVAVGLGVGWARLRVGMGCQLLAVVTGMVVALVCLMLPPGGAALVAGMRWHPTRWGWAALVAMLLLLPVLAVSGFGWVMLRHELRLVRRRLEEEAAFGVLPAWLPVLAASPVRRSSPKWWPRRDERRALNRMLHELAIKKERVTALDAEAARVYGLEVGRLRQRLRTLLDPTWAPAAEAERALD